MPWAEEESGGPLKSPGDGSGTTKVETDPSQDGLKDPIYSVYIYMRIVFL